MSAVNICIGSSPLLIYSKSLHHDLKGVTWCLDAYQSLNISYDDSVNELCVESSSMLTKHRHLARAN